MLLQLWGETEEGQGLGIEANQRKQCMGSRDPETGRISKFIRNVRKYLPEYTESHPGRYFNNSAKEEGRDA
jgi:hypothetical protein